MEQGPGATSWWHTMPGVLTAVAGLVTAAAGLIVALNQAGILGGGQDAAPADTAVAPSVAAAPEPTEAAAGTEERVNAGGSMLDLTAEPAQVTLGEATYTIEAIASSARTGRTSTLRLRVGVLNSSDYSMNFWDASFRLLVGGVPRAPVGGLNRVVPGRSADEGEVVFVVPVGDAPLVLRISLDGEEADIELR